MIYWQFCFQKLQNRTCQCETSIALYGQHPTQAAPRGRVRGGTVQAVYLPEMSNFPAPLVPLHAQQSLHQTTGDLGTWLLHESVQDGCLWPFSGKTPTNWNPILLRIIGALPPLSWHTVKTISTHRCQKRREKPPLAARINVKSNVMYCLRHWVLPVSRCVEGETDPLYENPPGKYSLNWFQQVHLHSRMRKPIQNICIYIYIISSHSIATTASPLITVIVASIFRQPKRVRVLALQVNPNGSVCDIFNHLFDLAQIFVFQSQKKAPFRIELNLQISLVYAKIPEFLRNIHHHSPALPLHFPTSGVCSVALKKSVWTLGFF